MPTRTYEQVSVGKLTPHPDNPRRGDTAAIKSSIEANGFVGALVAQRSTGHVLAGNHRLIAATELGLKTVPVLWVDADDDRARRILLADNRTSDLATWDEAALVELLGEMSVTEEELLGTAFSQDDLSDLLARQARAAQPRVTGDGDRMTPAVGEQLERYEQANVRYVMLEYDVDTFTKVVAALDSYRDAHGVADNATAVRRLLGVE
jgi:ParB-like chromosome segregation protein Spo0J